MQTSILERDSAATKAVTARLNYLAEATPKPVNYAYDPPAGVLRRSGKYVEQNIAIRNDRAMLGKLSLDTNGFVLTEHETAVKDFYGPDEVKSVYYPEVERLLKRVTGAIRKTPSGGHDARGAACRIQEHADAGIEAVNRLTAAWSGNR